MQPGSTPRGSTPYQNPPTGMPGGSGTQTPAHQTFRMLAEVIHGPWAFTRQAYRRSAQKLGVPDLNAMPLSAGVSEAPIYQHASTPYAQWASGSAAGGSTVHSHPHAGAYPAMAEQPISKNKGPLPKLKIKGGDPTTLTRLINEWVQKTSIALNTWSVEASNFWSQAVTAARNQQNWWLSLSPSDRAAQIGLPTTLQTLPRQIPVLEATMQAELINSVLPERVTSTATEGHFDSS